MLRFLVRRLLLGALVLWLVSMAVFYIFYVLNSSGADSVAHRLGGRQATPQTIKAIKHRLHLDDSVPKQYWYFLFGYPGSGDNPDIPENKGLLHGDLGYSYINQQSVNEKLKDAFPITLSLALGASILWLAMGLFSGVWSAIRPRSLLDRGFTLTAFFFYSLPTFVLGYVLLLVFYYYLTKAGHAWFPAGDYVPFTENPWQWARHLFLPWFTLAAVTAAAYTRLTRGSMLDVLGEDYIRTARAKGLPERRVVFRHALRAALTPVVTQFGIDLGTLVGGAIVTEKLFGLPGLGFTAINAIQGQDLPVILGITMLAATAIVVANLVVDVLYAVLDPRVRLH
jgi:peptide/nickel transport system permease protein